VVGLALAAIGNIASSELARDCAPEVEKLLDCPNPYIRKKVRMRITLGYHFHQLTILLKSPPKP
jgi:hypothetical protein